MGRGNVTAGLPREALEQRPEETEEQDMMAPARIRRPRKHIDNPKVKGGDTTTGHNVTYSWPTQV